MRHLRASHRQKQAFSLVEILSVIVIVSILTLTTLSFSVLRSSALTSSGNQIVDVFAMARQNSIAKNDYTAVVIDTQGTGACKAYCLLELTRRDDGTFGSWTAVTPWRYLGNGVVFEDTAATASIDTFMQTSASASLPVPLPSSFPFQGQSINLNSAGIAVQCYQSDGTLVGSQPLRLRLVEGIVDSNGNLTYQGAKPSGTQVSYYDLVFVANTGVTKIERP